mgnify:CR=1 FL=1
MRWAIKLASKNRLDGYKEHFVHEAMGDQRANVPVIFVSRDAARDYVKEHFGYRTRKDLRREPHGWLPAKVCKVTLTISEI